MKIRAFRFVFKGDSAEVCSFRGFKGLARWTLRLPKGDLRLPQSLPLVPRQEIFDGPWTSRAFRVNFGLFAKLMFG